MLQIKIIQDAELNSAVNEFLATIDEDAVRDLNIDTYRSEAIIQYVIKENWAERMCCECQFWDDGGQNNTSGLCQHNGKRVRFNCRACKYYKDVRG